MKLTNSSNTKNNHQVPTGWQQRSLASICSMKSGSSITSENITSHDKYPCYGGNGLRGYTKTFTHDGGYALIGRQGALCGNVNFVSGKFFASEHAIVVTPNSDMDIKWLFYVLDRMQLNQYSESSAQPGLSVQKIIELPVSIPPTKSEQTAIATVLNDADALITGLEKLIAKKRLIKQGVMQKLLKPKVGWETKPLGEFIEKFIDYRGVTPKKLGMDWGEGEIPALSANNVQMGFIDFTKECYFGSDKLYKAWMRNGDCEMNDILMTLEAPLGNIAYVPDNRKYILSQRTILIRPVDTIDKTFLRYLLMHEQFQATLKENASGSTAQGIQRKSLEKILVTLPKLKEDQRQIAEVLEALDQEIAILNLRLRKTCKLKLGMMQTLLTGKIRLI